MREGTGIGRIKKVYRDFATLENLYYSIFVILIITAILTPYAIENGLGIFAAEDLEVILIMSQLVIAFYVYSLYKKQLNIVHERLGEALNYIGEMNVQVQHLKEVFSEIDKYPDNYNQFKKVMKLVVEKIAFISDCSWAMLRIIDKENLKTLIENFYKKPGVLDISLQVSGFANKGLVESRIAKRWGLVKSSEPKLKIGLYCILPRKLDLSQEMIVNKIIDNLEMMFVVFLLRKGEKRLFLDEK